MGRSYTKWKTARAARVRKIGLAARALPEDLADGEGTVGGFNPEEVGGADPTGGVATGGAAGGGGFA